MKFSQIAFGAFAVFSVAALAVTSVWAWKDIQAEREEHEGIVRNAAGKIDLGAVGDFSFTERSGKKIEKKDLAGKVWVAGFIFTHCAGPCPKLSDEMSRLQKDFAKLDIRLVSFSVDPERDTPEALREYADRYQADKNKWLFLTGSKDAMHSFIKDSFHLAVAEETGEDRLLGMEIAHSSKLVLVDADAKIRGYFSGTDPLSLESLRRKAEGLVPKNP